MKNILLGLLVVVLIAGGVGGTWYYMDTQLKAANQQITLAQGETLVAKTQVSTLEADLKGKADREMAEQQLLTSLEALMMSGTGVDMTALASVYDENVMVEGTLTGVSLRSYALALQKYNKSLPVKEVVKSLPVKFVSGDWSVIVRTQDKTVAAPLILNQSGAVVRAPSKIEQEMILTLAKWQDGKIKEQYEFAFTGDPSKSQLLKMMTQDSPDISAKLMEGSTATSDTPTSGNTDIIPAESSQTLSGASVGSGSTK